MTPNCNCSSLLPVPYDFRKNVISFGTFSRRCDGSKVKRYRYKCCGKTFSDSTSHETYRQKKPHLNEPIIHHLAGGFSQRRTAFVLKTNRKTVIRKFLLMGERAENSISKMGRLFRQAKSISFDELETYEHTRCKPLSVIVAIETHSRRILGFKVSAMPAKLVNSQKFRLENTESEWTEEKKPDKTYFRKFQTW